MAQPVATLLEELYNYPGIPAGTVLTLEWTEVDDGVTWYIFSAGEHRLQLRTNEFKWGI
jgi:hypothetical protein